MTSKERYDFMKKVAPAYNRTEVEVVEELVTRLIESLYLPVGEKGMFHVDPDRLRIYKIGHEPINWGGLICNEVKKFEDGSFLATIEEASPGDCPTFCEYIEKYMKKWGWNVRVETEW